jgi:CubicO group peptidase (beta-lactamase class C family)
MATATATAFPKQDQLEDLIRDEMERLHVPGVSAGIIVDGQEHVSAFGVTNVNYPSPVLPETLFQIGSTTKTVTATTIMRLVEEGKIDLDAPVRTYLPDLRLKDEGVAGAVTVRQLMNHTAGWTGDHFADLGRGDDALSKIVAGMVELEQVTPLGEIWSYNNAAFYLAGRVIEAATGKPYEIAARELVLLPLGMTSSFYFPEDVMTHSFAVGHNVVEDKPSVTSPWALARTANPAGGIASTAGDQLRYARFHMGDGTAEDGTRVLSAEAIALMQTPTVDASDSAKMGLSWMITDVQGTKIVAHGGSTNGQQSSFLFAPERNFALTVLTNAGPGAQVAEAVRKWAFEQYLGIVEPETVHEDRSADQLAEYLGTYANSMSALTLRIEDSQLMLDYELTGKLPTDTPPPVPPPTRVAFHGNDRIVALDGPFTDAKGEFLRDSEGELAWLRLGGRVHRRTS